MALKADTKYRMFIALADKTAGDDLVAAVETGASAATVASVTTLSGKITSISNQIGFVIKTVIVATSTSTTTDFAALAVGDQVLHIPATAGNAEFFTVATLGTLPAAAVIGDLYVVLRAYVAP